LKVLTIFFNNLFYINRKTFILYKYLILIPAVYIWIKDVNLILNSDGLVKDLLNIETPGSYSFFHFLSPLGIQISYLLILISALYFIWESSYWAYAVFAFIQINALTFWANYGFFDCSEDYYRAFLTIGFLCPWHYLRKKKSESDQEYFFSIAYFLLIVQTGVTYFFAAHFKYLHSWSENWDAVYLVLLRYKLNVFASFLTNYPVFCKVLSIFSLLFEYLVPFLLLIPLRNKKVRLMIIITIIGFHAGIALTIPFTFSFLIVFSIFPILYFTNSKSSSFEQYPRITSNDITPILASVVYVFIIFTTNFQSIGYRILPVSFYQSIEKLSLNQSWGMFSQANKYQFSVDGYVVDRNGNEKNLSSIYLEADTHLSLEEMSFLGVPHSIINTLRFVNVINALQAHDLKKHLFLQKISNAMARSLCREISGEYNFPIKDGLIIKLVSRSNLLETNELQYERVIENHDCLTGDSPNHRESTL